MCDRSAPLGKLLSPAPLPRGREVLGVRGSFMVVKPPNMRAADPDYEALINANTWHDRSELYGFVAAIFRLSEKPKWTDKGEYAEGSNRWSWARNMDCKYVDLRIDMRDGGFVLVARDGAEKARISLKMLEWQYGEDRP